MYGICGSNLSEGGYKADVYCVCYLSKGGYVTQTCIVYLSSSTRADSCSVYLTSARVDMYGRCVSNLSNGGYVWQMCI